MRGQCYNGVIDVIADAMSDIRLLTEIYSIPYSMYFTNTANHFNFPPATSDVVGVEFSQKTSDP